MSKLIETSDGILIEVESDGGEKCSAGTADKVEKGFNQISPLLRKACSAMREFWQEQTEGIDLQEVEIQFGLNFEGSGNVFIAQAKAGASLTVKAVMKKSAE
ncbi:MAG: hypothetical protein J5I93_22040 [Pirellulaceae bacterium]|nr:hypothetical protein [Pirellulaceae bacterium]